MSIFGLRFLGFDAMQSGKYLLNSLDTYLREVQRTYGQKQTVSFARQGLGIHVR
jgi:hypothetical protein